VARVGLKNVLTGHGSTLALVGLLATIIVAFRKLTFSRQAYRQCTKRRLSGSPRFNQDGGNCRSGIAVFVQDVSGATNTDRGAISERENEWRRIFFALLCVGGGLFYLAGLKR
jgi:hypothetical protein